MFDKQVFYSKKTLFISIISYFHRIIPLLIYQNSQMKNIYALLLLCFTVGANAQTPFERVYTVLNTKCQNSTCHSANSADLPKFDGDINAVYNSIYEVQAQNGSSVAKHEKLIKAGHPYMSYLLRKVAGAGFDTDLSLEATEGDLMKDINGNTLERAEIEFIRQWTMYGAKKTYTGSEPKPNWQLVSDYYANSTSLPFLPKPDKPAANEGLQLRMGPVFLPVTGETEQEWMLQQEVNFPVLPQVERIVGIMNQQSHHFLLFQFYDSLSAAQRARSGNDTSLFGMKKVSISTGISSFEGDKLLTSAWQDDEEFVLPTGTALFWEQKTYLDMNYHVKNYNATGILPCDFYYNVYFKPRNSNTIEMKANLVNNATLILPQGEQSRDYDDQDNNSTTKEWRYVWTMTSHSHKYGKDYDIYIRDTTGTITEKVYEGFYDYKNDYDKGYYDWEHPATRTIPNFLPVKYGRHNGKKAGLVARTKWQVNEPLVTFGFTTADEMQLFYYFYTNQLPEGTTAINDADAKKIQFDVMPNPMNNSGKLVYTLEQGATVEATVVDITGKLVAELGKETQTAGTHAITIGNGGELSNGIYFARLNINGNIYTKKFVVAD